jgi:DNA polymerase V
VTVALSFRQDRLPRTEASNDLAVARCSYHKAGITLMNIMPAKNQQFSLFASGGAVDARSQQLMGVIDGINGKYGRGTMRLAAE